MTSRSGWRREAFGLVSVIAFAAVSACYNKDNPCGDHFVLSPSGKSCVCGEGAVYIDGRCLSCAEDEVPTSQGCVCPEGQEKNNQGICTELKIGAACTNDDACSQPFDRCYLPGGYCTSHGCGNSDECPGQYACMELPASSGEGGAFSQSTTFCRRPPIGLGQSCSDQVDCLGTEATYCEVFGTCAVQGCRFDPDDCFEGYDCCDLGAYGVPEPLCVPEGYCVE